ncbi:MAG: Asparagine synthetase [Steroidobacteraceae bacterium]|jgi:asparagine synthase (glutamine-hydrolysing)|nr:Asparagine synthetase [Steroidobacteraceae bacterium]
MCGIAGYVDFSGHQPEQARERLKRMTDAIAHRGPDGEGFYVDGHAALGHRRLAIIDVSGGHQPMAGADGKVQIVFNGEIYNYLQLRAELESLGHTFRTNSDTEAIIGAYLQWGENCAERLNGMFAFAIWDTRTQALFLARDRVGKKPMYYFRRGSVVAFASELKALRATGWCPDALDPEALDCYFSFGYIPAPKTIYRNVSKLRAARTLHVTAARETERQYWQLKFGAPVERSLESATEEFESLLDDAVRCRLMSEVPLGAFLSGGLDSSLVVSSMARASSRPVITNSIGFDDRKFSELGAAKAIAEHLGTDHHEFVVQPRATDVLEKIAWHFDEPLADSSAIPTWYVCEMARRTVTVALSGDGGDEGFGGYTFRYVPHVFESRLRGALPLAVRSPLFGLLGSVWPASARLPQPLRLKTIFENLAVSDSEAYYRDLLWLRADARAALYTPEFMRSLNGYTPAEAVLPFYANTDASSPLARSQNADIHFYMTDDVLAKADRMSMAHSLEVRCPLLDHRLIEFGVRLPDNLKIDGRQGKVVLRELAGRRLPEAIRNLPKQGFSIPAATWLRKELRPMTEGLLFNGTDPFDGLLDPAVVRRMWREHLSAARDHSVFLWGLMMLALWRRTSVMETRPA